MNTPALPPSSSDPLACLIADKGGSLFNPEYDLKRDLDPLPLSDSDDRTYLLAVHTTGTLTKLLEGLAGGKNERDLVTPFAVDLLREQNIPLAEGMRAIQRWVKALYASGIVEQPAPIAEAAPADDTPSAVAPDAPWYLRYQGKPWDEEKCPKCNELFSLLPGSNETCLHCGADNPFLHGWYCPQCGTLSNPPEHRFCFRCKANRPADSPVRTWAESRRLAERGTRHIRTAKKTFFYIAAGCTALVGLPLCIAFPPLGLFLVFGAMMFFAMAANA